MVEVDLAYYYSGTTLLWTPWEPGKVSCIERCPHFRVIKKAYLGRSKIPLIQRCLYFRGVLQKGSTAYNIECKIPYLEACSLLGK